MFLFLSLGIINLQFIQGNRFKDLSNKNCIRLLPQMGARGAILDREGNIIVGNKLSYDCLVMPGGANQIDKILTAVSGILGITPEDLKDTFKLRLTVSSMPVTIAKNIDIKKAIALEELKNDIPGVIIQPKPQRLYPYGSLASHVIGYVSEIDRWRLTKLADYGYKNKDYVGFGGVEEKYDYYLRQEEGGSSIEVDHRGRSMRLLGFKPGRNGKNIQLTLNLKIQKIVEDRLKGRKGSVLLMDPFTGEIIAMASFPNFNPSIFVDKPRPSISNLFNDSDAPLINRAISGLYPPGSIFKIIVATAALETRKINLSTTFNCAGRTLIGKQEFSCWNTHNQQGLIAAIAYSCNIFFYKAGLLLGAQAIHDYAIKFGLSRPAALGLPYEAGGFIPSPLWKKINKFQNWFDGDTVNLSIGQGDCLVTPLQMARLLAVFANKGYLVNPYIVKAVDGKDISIHRKSAADLGLKKETIDYIRQGLRGAIYDPAGTGNVLSDLAVSVAGKTGTAQAPPGQAHAWFAGFFPFENPKFVICVLLERGGPGYYSCVLAKQIIEAIIAEGLI
jgi:penicillin-binding protein 2